MSYASLEYIREDLKFASQHGLHSESLEKKFKLAEAKFRLDRAKKEIENMLQGGSYPPLEYIREDLKFASQNGLDAESLLLEKQFKLAEAKFRLDRAKTEIENILQDSILPDMSYASLQYIREDLKFASRHGLHAGIITTRE